MSVLRLLQSLHLSLHQQLIDEDPGAFSFMEIATVFDLGTNPSNTKDGDYTWGCNEKFTGQSSLMLILRPAVLRPKHDQGISI